MENVIFTPTQKIQNLQYDSCFINLYRYTFWEIVKGKNGGLFRVLIISNKNFTSK